MPPDEKTDVYCEDLHFSYESSSQEVLRGVQAEVNQGEYVVVAGPSGAGKSTFCRTLNNIIPLFYRGNFSGKRWIAGKWLERQSISSMAADVGIVFQDFEQQLFSTSSLLELSFGLENFGVPRPEMQERIQELVDRFHLQSLVNREPFSLSGGEKQKLAIASVIAFRPQILVLDEPTTDLDPESREFVLQIIPKLKNWVKTLIVIDYETEQFLTADRVLLFSKGAVQTGGLAKEILAESSLLEQNSLSPLDLIRVQELLKMTSRSFSVPELVPALNGYRLSVIPTPARLSSPAVVQIEHLSFRYADQPDAALKDVSCEIREGEFVGIIGRNGSGKSTLMRHLNGLQIPQAGSVKIFGKESRVWDRKELSRLVGLVFQNPDHQIFESTVRNEVEFGPRRFGLPEDEIQSNVKRAIETMDLSNQIESDPFQLSKGERQRVAVASVLSSKPKVLILDEPTTGLDSKQQQYLMNLLRELNQSGVTIIIVTHALKLVAEFCTYSILLQDGQKAAEGHPRDVFFSRAMVKLPTLMELSREMKGNALSVQEFVTNLKPQSI
jgi:energy-coupling factor transport system ATP-binding protein